MSDERYCRYTKFGPSFPLSHIGERCEDCGSFVINKDEHDRFRRTLDGLAGAFAGSLPLRVWLVRWRWRRPRKISLPSLALSADREVTRSA
jgi:hypothetical protein